MHVEISDAILHRLSRWTKRTLWRPLRQTAATIHPAPLVVAGVLAWLFATKGQFREAYIAYLEKPSLAGIALSGLALYLLSAALYYGNYLLSTIRIDIIYSESANLRADRRLRTIRNWVGLACAALPWAGVVLGLFFAIGVIDGISGSLRSAMETVAHAPGGSSGREIAGLDAMRAQIVRAAWLAGLCVLAVPATLHPLQRKRWFRRSIAVVAGLVCVAALGLPLVGDPAPLYVLAGPVPAAAVIGLFAFAVLGTLAWLSRHTGFPLGVFLVAIVVIAAAFEVPLVLVSYGLCILLAALALLALLSRQSALALLTMILAAFAGLTAHRLWSEGRPASDGDAQAVRQMREPRTLFAQWLAKRADLPAYRKANRRYPVFIVAAEGGGIYATAAATIFLSRLQDRCPNFAQHVFAVSGVSGGAIGAALFHSLIAQQGPVASAGCTGGSGRGTLETQAKDIVVEDHLSPLFGEAIPDLVGLPVDRSRALEKSFVRSAKHHAARIGSHERLGARFDEHWSAGSAAPALVLNATSVETGYRVAFSPFSFRGQADRTLFSFSDEDQARDPKLTVIGAAVVSARFPGILPAYSFRRPPQTPGQPAGLINFVDGAYADGSGAETALSLYRAIKDTADKAEVDVRVILLTSETPPPDLNSEVGTEARDLLAPVYTLLNVRDLLALQAVTRALAELDPHIGGRGAPQATPAGTDGSQDVGQWRAAVITLDQRFFDLPLGWMISRTTHGVVSLMVGRPELCAPAKAKRPQAGDRRDLFIPENSCVMRAIEDLLAPPPG
jgi:hypothetical protein